MLGAWLIVGVVDGQALGWTLVLGAALGLPEGKTLGEREGISDGKALGDPVGLILGAWLVVGGSDGAELG